MSECQYVKMRPNQKGLFFAPSLQRNKFFRVPVVDLRGEDINANPNEENSEDILDFSTNSFGSSDYSTYYNYDYYDNFNENEYSSTINNSSRRKRYGVLKSLKCYFFLML